MAGEVNLSVKLNRSYFPIVDQPQLIYALVEVVPGDVVASVRMPLNFSLVLDQSGSMKDEGKLDQLKQAVKYVIDLLEDDDHISIVTFSGNAVCNLRLVGGIQPRRVWRVVPAIGDLGHGPLSDRAISARLGELEKNVGQALLVELLCSPRPAGRYRLAQAEASYDVPQLGVTSERTRSDVLVEFTPNPALSSQVNPEVMNIVARTGLQAADHGLERGRGRQRGRRPAKARQCGDHVAQPGRNRTGRTASGRDPTPGPGAGHLVRRPQDDPVQEQQDGPAWRLIVNCAAKGSSDEAELSAKSLANATEGGARPHNSD